MTRFDDTPSANDPFDLSRFVQTQDDDYYEGALAELISGALNPSPPQSRYGGNSQADRRGTAGFWISTTTRKPAKACSPA